MQNISELKETVKMKTAIADVIGKFIKLKKNGSEFTGLCPFHVERSPSFSVSNAKGIFKCFGCGAAGDVIEFVMKHQNVNFVDAISIIATAENIPVNFEENAPKGSKHKQSARNTNFVNRDVVRKSLACYPTNPLFGFLEKLLGFERTFEIFMKFYVGTGKGNATIFWQVDQFLRVRTAQRICYDQTGHRIKTIPPKRMFTSEENYHPCFFGEHQLFEAVKDDMIGIVESEKSAMACTAFLPEIDGKRMIWIACGGMNGITEEKAFALSGMNVCLVPDFHFVSRMVWGIIPMRKAVDPADGRMKPAIDGEIEEGYVSVAARLAKIGCTVSFYNPFPDLEDKSDIADFLLDNSVLAPVVPESLEMPNFDGLLLPGATF